MVAESQNSNEYQGEMQHLPVNGLLAYENLTAFLDQDGWYPQPIEEETILRLLYTGKNGEFRCFAQIRVDIEQFIFYCVAPIKVPEELRPAVVEFISRANFGLRIGNFEMDFTDGEVRYKTSLDFVGQELTEGWIRNTIYPAIQTLDRYLPGLMGVVYGGRTPVEAILEVEQI